IAKILTSENNHQVWFKVQDASLMKYILYKGFIGVDGISLTVGIGVFLMPGAVRRFGKKKVYIGGLLIWVAGDLLNYFFGGGSVS
ncbi:hypothetical protein MJN54_33040, partial [Salmonella enterica subsp. enterica serovar Kentucky]|nr:hypothetical protein [Salmonella enterica subsp. enterica serovar Kentucky]